MTVREVEFQPERSLTRSAISESDKSRACQTKAKRAIGTVDRLRPAILLSVVGRAREKKETGSFVSPMRRIAASGQNCLSARSTLVRSIDQGKAERHQPCRIGGPNCARWSIPPTRSPTVAGVGPGAAE
jgi:hypothetical protein